jgi:hypothetical protein
MQINPAQARSGSIVLEENIPSVSIGRTVIATVLSAPKGGFVLVSMFGKRLLVETTMPLQKGQVLNLKVQAVTPKIVLKPSQPDMPEQSSPLRDLSSGLSRIVGNFGEKPISSFLVQETIRQLSSQGDQDAQSAQFVTALFDQIYQYPQAFAYLFIPLVGEDSGSRAQVSIEHDENAYTVNLDIETENLGSIECRARMDKDKMIDVEIKTPSGEVADFLRSRLSELRESLEPLGIRSLEVLRSALRKQSAKEVDVLV